MADVLAILLLGLFLGIRHATDADHVVAVTTIVSRERRLLGAVAIGAMWGVGHTLTILLVGGAIVLFGIVIPPRVGLSMEFSVALMLVALGFLNISGAWRSLRSHAGHDHHASDADTPHGHSHSLFPTAATPTLFRPLAVGVVHGLAGSAAIALLVLATIRTPGWALVYLAVFGLGTILGMAALTLMIAVPVSRAAATSVSLERALVRLTGVVSIVFGLVLVYRIGFVDGLFLGGTTDVDASLRRAAASALRLFGAFATCALLAGSAGAHTPLLSESELEWRAGVVRAVFVLSWQDAVTLARALPPAGRAAAGASAGFAGVFERGVTVLADAAPCTPELESAESHQGDGFAFVGVFRCAPGARSVRVELPFLGRLADGHRHLLRFRANGAPPAEATLSAASPRATFSVPEAKAPPSAPAPAPVSFVKTALSAVSLGTMHVLSGLDHVLFIVAVAFGVRRLRGAILPVTAFTVAHSLTLALAALSVFVPSPRIVEPLIAASIAVLAFDDALRKETSHHAALTFLFGLVHGAGFASALSALSLGRDRLLPTLVGFNVGVELGQLLVLTVTFPAVFWLKNRDEGRIARAFCLALGVVGLVWCGERLLAG